MSSHESGRHPVNIGHLVMGLAFLGLVTVWAVVQSDTVSDDDIRWLLPVPWVLAGAAGLVATAFSARRQAAHQTGWIGSADAVDEPVEPDEEPDEEPAEPVDEPVEGPVEGPVEDHHPQETSMPERTGDPETEPGN